MRLAVYHNLPSGGALHVLESFLRHVELERVELFLPETANDRFVQLSRHAARTTRIPARIPRRRYAEYVIPRVAPACGRAAARAIDAGRFDAALVGASTLTQAPEVLPYLRTPSLYYAPEHRRAQYDRRVDHPRRTMRALAFDASYAPLEAWLKRFDRTSIGRATSVFTHSRFAAENLRRVYGVDAAVVRLGVDATLYRPLRRPRERLVLSVGALDPRKGHQFVIEALAAVPPARRPRLAVVGDRGDYESELRRLAGRAGVELRVERDLPFEALVDLYNRAAVLAAGQVEEPLGLVTLEAMACETPVVAVAEGGLRETVENGRTGLLTPRDPLAFGDALQRVLDDPELAARLGRQGRAHVLEHWRWSDTARAICWLLERTAGEVNGPRRARRGRRAWAAPG